nr:reverse transcriptase domain-containing protein [Tanacetum cinerariifolium]
TPGEKKAHPTNLTVPLHPNFLDQEVVVRGSLSDKGHTELCALLKRNLDIFAWQPSDMTGNAGATYERLMDKAFESQMGQNIEVYVDNLVVKSHTEAEMVRDIEETFQTLRKISMKLNPKKCSFGLAEGVFLGYVITPEGIKPCPDKTTVVLQLPSPQIIKEVKSLNGKLASLNRSRTSVPAAETAFIRSPSIGRTQTTGRADHFAASNNEAEYEALIVGLRIAMQMGVKNIQANVDSKLVANQVLGTYVAKEDNRIKYLEIAKGLVSGFKTFSISQVPRSRNKKADALSKIVSTSFAHLSKQVLVEVLETKSITGKEVTSVIREEGPTWITELMNYLKEGILHRDEKEARKLRLKARQYELMEGVLYKRSFLTPWLRCVGPLQAKPFPEGPEKVKFLIVAMDYFTKWIEVKAVATITSGQVKKFVWDNIVCRFGIPREIISDNGKQFADNPFKDWCDKLKITQSFASVKHPQSNGLVERANRSLGEGIKVRLGEGNKNWVEELPHVLWAH